MIMKILKVLALSVLGFGMFAFVIYGGPKIPQKVVDAFANMFPTAKSVKWGKESKIEWEAEFKIDEVEYSANFLNDGTWVETESVIEENEVPENLKKALSMVFPGYKMKHAEKSQTKDGTFFEFKIKGESKEVVMDTHGNIINESKGATED